MAGALGALPISPATRLFINTNNTYDGDLIALLDEGSMVSWCPPQCHSPPSQPSRTEGGSISIIGFPTA